MPRILYSVESAAPVACGHKSSLRTTDGVIAINPQEESYLNLTQTTQITLRVGTEFLSFVLTNAAASLRDGLLTVLAEEVRPMPAAPVSAASRNGGPSP